jgi:hypothetical protein
MPKTVNPLFKVIYRRSRKSELSSHILLSLKRHICLYLKAHISIYASVDGRSAPSGKRWTMDQVERWTRFYFFLDPKPAFNKSRLLVFKIPSSRKVPAKQGKSVHLIFISDSRLFGSSRFSLSNVLALLETL